MSDEIKSMRELANLLEEFAEKKALNMDLAGVEYFVSLSQVLTGHADKEADLGMALRWLQFDNKSDMAKMLSGTAGELIKCALRVKEADGQANFRDSFVYRDLAKSFAAGLAKSLRHIADMAEEERKATPKNKTKLKKRKAVVRPSKFKKWQDSSDACYIINEKRVEFHHNGKIKDLRLKYESRTYNLITLLANGSQSSELIHCTLCSNGTKPANLKWQANKLLNEKLALLGFRQVPKNTEFVRFDSLHNQYELALPVLPSRDKLETWLLEREPDFVDDRRTKQLDDERKVY